MNKQVCTPGKLLKNYIIDYLVWGIFVAVLVGILQIVSDSLIVTFGLGSLLLIAITVLLNIAGNFLVIFLTIRTLFKKYTILGVDVKSFLNKTIIFYVIILILFVVYNLLGYTSFIVETINLVLNVLILVFQFFYTRYMTMKEVSNNGINNQINSNINIEQNNDAYNQVLNDNTLNQIPDNQVQNQDNGQFNQNNMNVYNNNVFVDNQINENVYDNNINQDNQEVISNNITDVSLGNEFIQDVNVDNDINVQNVIGDYVAEEKQGISINSIDNNKVVNSIKNFESDNAKNNQVKTKICPGCGKEISINNNFCNLCGYVYKN